ncbi:MAG: antibiotic biosynthesis monooxygenase [Mogibacterium sp.]|nr:antibiotic biosynthesis monooxygenase [Mogibacterium sp.]
MIVLNVTYKCKPGMREAFLDAIKAEGLDAASRTEEGNCKYDYYFAADSPDELFLLEHWRDAEAVAIHNEMPHFKRLGELKKDFVDETDLKKYTI